MTSKDFDPRKFIDREFEQELFEELLRLCDAARILAIRDAGGMGKSHLLEKFQHRCRSVRPRIAFCLVALDQLPGDSPLELVRRMARQLERSGLGLPLFARSERARAHSEPLLPGPAGDRMALRAVLLARFNLAELRDLCFDLGVDYESLPGETRADKARELLAYWERHHGTGELAARVRQLRPGAFAQAGEAGDGPTPAGERETLTQQASVDAFFDDLAAASAARPVVLMLDAFERCGPTIRGWIVEELLERCCFDMERRPAKLVVVLAGRELPVFEGYWSLEECAAVVRSVHELRKWSRAHVEECLAAHGFAYQQHDVDAFHRLIEMGIPPSQIVQLIQTAQMAQRRQ